jgi:hypothetical protein
MCTAGKNRLPMLEAWFSTENIFENNAKQGPTAMKPRGLEF